MKITIDIPDWAQERHIYVFAGMEVLAAKPYGLDKLRIKTARCNRCGLCCDNCDHLQKIGSSQECDYGIDMPFRCISGDILSTDANRVDECSIRYREVDIEK